MTDLPSSPVNARFNRRQLLPSEIETLPATDDLPATGPTATGPTATGPTPGEPETVALQPETASHSATSQMQAGKQAHRQRQYGTALAHFEAALSQYTQRQDAKGMGQALNAIALTQYSLGRYLQSIQAAQQSYQLGKTTGCLAIQQEALGHQGNSYRHQGNLDQAIILMKRSVACAEALKDTKATITSLNNLGMAYRAQNRDDLALLCYERSLSLADDLGQVTLLKRVLRNTGNLHHTLGNYRSTINCYERLLKIARDQMDVRVTNKILRNLSNACYMVRDYGRAISYNQQRLALVQQLGDLKAQEEVLESLCISYDASGKPMEVLRCHEERLQVCMALQDRALQCQALSNFKTACLAVGEFDRLLQYASLIEQLVSE